MGHMSSLVPWSSKASSSSDPVGALAWHCVMRNTCFHITFHMVKLSSARERTRKGWGLQKVVWAGRALAGQSSIVGTSNTSAVLVPIGSVGGAIFGVAYSSLLYQISLILIKRISVSATSRLNAALGRLKSCIQGSWS